jgi:nicotinate-nucleotide--dimethylbenzimidazole phosphoribosyltransferase
MTTGLPFDDFRDLLRRLPGPDQDAAARVREQFCKMDKRAGSLGRLEEIAEWLAAWSGRAPAVTRPLVAVFAGNHGIARRGVCLHPLERTAALVELTAAGGAAINQLCAANDFGLKVFDLALDLPTADIANEAAMDERSCAATMAFGMEAVAGGTDLLCIGDMGAGNSTVAAALAAALFGGSAAQWLGPGTGGPDDVTDLQAAVVDQALGLHREHLSDPLEALRRVGGREFAAIAGAILAARMQKVPVILDGFATTAAAAVLYKQDPRALDHCMLGHLSPVQGHSKLAAGLGKRPLLDLGLSHGEAAGAALAGAIVKAAALCHSGMAAALPQR